MKLEIRLSGILQETNLNKKILEKIFRKDFRKQMFKISRRETKIKFILLYLT